MCTPLTNICQRCSVSHIIYVLWFRRQPISKLSLLGIYNADTISILTAALMCEMQCKKSFSTSPSYWLCEYIWKRSLLSHRSCCYIYCIQTNSFTLFKTHSHPHSQPNISQTGTSGTDTHRQHTATYQINNWTKQTSREIITALSTKDGPLKMVKQ
jgi:hypothetical protein